jgi:hypothetical protein
MCLLACEKQRFFNDIDFFLKHSLWSAGLQNKPKTIIKQMLVLVDKLLTHNSPVSEKVLVKIAYCMSFMSRLTYSNYLNFVFQLSKQSGMAGGLETLCGQAYGAEQYKNLELILTLQSFLSFWSVSQSVFYGFSWTNC